MNSALNRDNRDWLGVAASTLCVIHCAAPALVLVVGGSLGAGAILGAEWMHRALVVVVTALALWSFLPSFRRHGQMTSLILMALGLPLLLAATLLGERYELPLSVLGGVAMISAHLLNRRSLLLSQ